MAVTERTLDLVDRLRGKYVLPINDGLGPINGKDTFTRQFETPPIHHEAAAEIEQLREALAEIAKGEGAFSRDPLEHASNTIEHMKFIATAALAGGA